MGYPMTWRRLINRNGLTDGGYDQPPQGWFSSGGAVAWDLVEGDSKDKILGLFRAVIDSQTEAAERRNQQVKLFAGDLRRLEHDTLDEGSICHEIARKLDFDPDMVAAVLREWLAV